MYDQKYPLYHPELEHESCGVRAGITTQPAHIFSAAWARAEDSTKDTRSVRVSFALFSRVFRFFGQNWYDSWYGRTIEARKP